MKLKEGEEVLTEYYFNRTKDTFQKGILTNNRLICITKASKDHQSEENFPLSKLTSVRVDKVRNGFRSKVLGFSIVAMLILLIVTGLMVFGENEPMWTEVGYLIPLYLVLILLIRFGLKPDTVKTNIVITQMGGIKRYSARNTKQLDEFIERINEQLI